MGSTTKMPSSLDFTTFHNIIGGRLEDTPKTRYSPNPSTLDPNPPVPVATQADVDRAVEVALEAGKGWAAVPIEERKKAVLDFADALEGMVEDFAQMLVKEQGKPLNLARMEITMGIDVVRGLVALPDPVKESKNPDGSRTVVRYTPIGLAVGIVPWNFPIYLACFKIAPAMITGNTLILKPSPFTPYCGLKLAELGMKFFPPGVFQALSGGDDLGPMLTAHPGVGKVSFTGSTATGKKVMESCAKTLKRVTLELGGNDPAIILDDVDVAAVAPQVAALALTNSGQVCIAIKRIYVHASIYDNFLAAMTAALKAMVTVGDGFKENVFMGPVQNAAQFERVKDMLADIAEKKLKIGNPETATAEEAPPGKGYFIRPTIIDNPPDDSRIVQEEPFGPVFPVLKWSDEEDMLRRANGTDMGLGASVWTKDLVRGEAIAKKLQAGTVWFNTHMMLFPNYPFGGHKQSGVGSELGVDGIKSYCNVQTLHFPA